MGQPEKVKAKSKLMQEIREISGLEAPSSERNRMEIGPSQGLSLDLGHMKKQGSTSHPEKLRLIRNC